MVEPTAEAARSLLGYDSLWTQKGVTHLITHEKGLAYPDPYKHQLLIIYTQLQTQEAERKLCNLWINLGRTLRVPGQVVCDGIKEELSCLLPLIVKLLLAIGVTDTHHAMLLANRCD